MREQVVGLEDDPDPPPDAVDVDVRVGDLALADEDPPVVDRLEEVDAAQQRRLAAPRRADEADHLVRRDDQVDPAQDLERPRRTCAALERRVGPSGRRPSHGRSLIGRPPRRAGGPGATSQSVKRASGIVTTRKMSAVAMYGVKLK